MTDVYENQWVVFRHASSYTTAKQTNMKSLILILYILHSQLQTVSSDSSSAVKNGQNVNIVLGNHLANYGHTDEVLITLDKADHTGAGVVIKKCYLNAGNTITLNGVPDGSYIATVKFKGLHNDVIEGRLTVGRKKHNIFKVKLKDCEVYSKDHVVIPAEKVDLSRLSITTAR